MAKGGKSYNDRIKSASVRNKVLDTILAVYAGKKVTGKKWELTLRMATTVLPRLNEHTGEDGKDLFPSPILAGKSKNGLSRNNSNKKVIGLEEEDPGC